MNLTPDLRRRIAVVGGGISGLAAAHRLFELDRTLDVALFEATDHLGGVLRTEACRGFLIEQSADMFTTSPPWALDLCRRIGLAEQLIDTNAKMRQAFIVHRGRLVAVPDGFSLLTPTRFWPMVTTPLLSWRGKLRLACECFTRARRTTTDESLASFTRRRLGSEVYEHLVQPLVGGIYSANPEHLSMAATMPQFVDLERRYGSLVRAIRRQAHQQSERHASGARYSLFVAPRQGMGSLVEAMAARLPDRWFRLNAAVRHLIPTADGGWDVQLDGRAEPFDAVIAATNAPQTARLLADHAPSLSNELNSIPHASTAVVVLGYAHRQVAHPLDGFGFVVPLVEQRRILACSFASVKFAGRAPDDQWLLRVFVGGACQPELATLPDDELLTLVQDELKELIGARGEPTICKIVRWQNATPQYHVGHLERVERIERHVAELANFQLAGNAYRGVGIPFCIQSGERAAERIAACETRDDESAIKGMSDSGSAE